MTLSFAFVAGSLPSQIVFFAICIAILLCFVVAVGRTAPPRGSNSFALMIRLSTVIGVYCLLIAAIVCSGVFSRAFIPFGPLFLVGTVSVATAVGFTRLGVNIAKGLPLAWLVGFQSFRLPLELVLHDWYRSGTIPETMTWTGSNWDIVSGILACLLCAFVDNRNWLAWIVNIVGIVLLINVGRVAVMSSPVPFGWQVDPPLELILYLPYAYIVPICVGGAALGHVLLTRKLLSLSL